MTTPVKITKKEWHRIAKDASENGVWIFDIDESVSIVMTKKFGKEVLREQYRWGKIEKVSKTLSCGLSEDIGYDLTTGLVSSFAMNYHGERVVPANCFAYYVDHNNWYHTQLGLPLCCVPATCDIWPGAIFDFGEIEE